MGELAERTRRFWFELWNDRDMDGLLKELHPDYLQVDHRALTDSGVTRSDWEQLMRSWWELAPDVAAVEFEPLADTDTICAYYIVFSGHDAVTGGSIEVAFWAVNGLREDRFANAEAFEDRDAALACFAARTAAA
jgi:hypothetical protein